MTKFVFGNFDDEVAAEEPKPHVRGATAARGLEVFRRPWPPFPAGGGGGESCTIIA